MKKKGVRPAKALAVFCLATAITGGLLYAAARQLPGIRWPADASTTQEPASQTVSTDGDSLIHVPYISQKGLLPTGCEIVSAVMVLQYYGYTLTAQEFVEDYLDKEPLYWVEDVRYGPDPRDAFVGDPFSAEGFGCYAPVIERALGRILSSQHRVVNTTGRSLDALVKEYIEKGVPVLVWATINLKPSYDSVSWTDTRTGETVTWRAREHCMVLVGCDDESYYFNDPYDGNGCMAYPRNKTEIRYAELGKQSLVILPS